VKASLLASHRRLALLALLVTLGFALAAVAASAPAMAKTKTCADQVVDDWYDNQRVDRLYPLHCYRDAIAGLPLDITDYSDAKEAILRALTYAQAGEGDPGPNARPAKNSPVKPITFRNTSGVWTKIGGTPGIDVAGPATQGTNTAGPSSVPIPLIVLAGLAGLLLLAGGAGYVARRMQSRRGGPPPPAV
jgi:hypothetical protein